MTWKPRRPDVLLAPDPLVPEVIGRVLFARGIETPERVQSFLAPSLKDIRDPFLIKGMTEAVDRLVRAFEMDEKVAVYADFDLDGTSGLALLKRGLENLGFKNLTHYQPKRLSEGYGVHVNAVHALKEQGVNVVVTVDVGITANDAAVACKASGIDLIVTDHHLAKSELPDAFTIVNPNQPGCTSGLGHLAGAGVAFYLVLALRKVFGERGLGSVEWDPKALLDCLVIGTITDMTPLKDENRVLIKHGLKQLSKTDRPGLKSLMETLNLWGRPIGSQDVAIGLAPKLNALSRMERGLMPLDVLLAPTEEAAQSLTAEILENNQLRRTLQNEAEKKALELAFKQSSRGFIWVWAQDFHKGVIGLVATKLAQEFGVPAFVGSDDGEVISGSARVPEGFPLSLLQIFDAAEEELLQFGGHAQAAGFKLLSRRASDFDQVLQMFFRSSLQTSYVKEWTYDTEARSSDFSNSIFKWFEALEPFGKDFPVPLFALKRHKVLDVRLLKEHHLKFTISDGTSHVSAIYFSAPVAQRSMQAGVTVDLLGEVQWNYFRGSRELQVLVRDLKIHA